jgi:hypothetical protein
LDAGDVMQAHVLQLPEAYGGGGGGGGGGGVVVRSSIEKAIVDVESQNAALMLADSSCLLVSLTASSPCSVTPVSIPAPCTDACFLRLRTSSSSKVRTGTTASSVFICLMPERIISASRFSACSFLSRLRHSLLIAYCDAFDHRQFTCHRLLPTILTDWRCTHRRTCSQVLLIPAAALLDALTRIISKLLHIAALQPRLKLSSTCSRRSLREMARVWSSEPGPVMLARSPL